MAVRADPINIHYATWITKLLLEVLERNVKTDADVHFLTILEWLRQRGVFIRTGIDLGSIKRVRNALFFLGFEQPRRNIYRIRVERLREINSWLSQ